jgi:LPS-assembly lipoprotein
MAVLARNTRRTGLVLAALLGLSACGGYHLRESTPLPNVLGVVVIEAVNLDSPLVMDLERELATAGATVKPMNTQGATLLKIVSETEERNVISLDERAKVGEYELHYRVTYAVDDAAGKPLLRDTPIDLSRVYSFDESQALGAAQEEAIIRAELRRDTVRQIMDRLARIQDPNRTEHKDPTPPK